MAWRLLLLSLAVAAGAGEGPRASVVLETASHGGKPSHFELRARYEDPSPAPLSWARDLPFAPRLELPLERPGGWTFTVAAPGFWSAPQTLRVGSEPLRFKLDLWALGEARGRLKVASNLQRPTSLVARFEPAEKAPGNAREAAPEGEAPCSLEAGAFRCELPLGVHHLRLSSPGFVPVYRWGVALPARPGRPVDLGEVSLQQGASVSGRIEVSGTGAPLAGCGVRLGIPSARASDDLETRRRLELLTASASSNAFGFFQLSGLAPGQYELQATCPGRAVATLAPVEVVQGLETRLKEPLVSGLPVSLSLAVVPPLDPYGRPWRLRLWAERSVPGAASSQTGTVDDNGEWQASGLQPELHHLLVLSEDGEGWMESEVDLRRGDARELVTIPLVEVRGRFLRGREPLPGVLLFGGRQAARSVRLPVDLEGRFEGFLPEEGPWWVVWQASRQDPGGTDLGEVEVRKRAGKSYAELELSLPDTRLSGQVVDESGRPVPSARVDASGSSQKTRGGRARAPQMTTDTDHDGKFELVGLPAGTATVSAVKPDQNLESDYQDVELREGEEGPELRLVLRSQRTFTGRVTGSGSPIPGARVFAGPDFASSPGGQGAEAVTDPTGSFTVRLRGTARWVDLVAWAPGHACAFRRFVADPSQRFEIDLPAAGGSLELELGSLAQAGSTVLWIGSTPVLAFSLDLLSRRGLVEAPAPGVFRLANTEPTTVLACQGRAAIAALLSDTPPPPEACVSGTIQVQANLKLQLPAGGQGGEGGGR